MSSASGVMNFTERKSLCKTLNRSRLRPRAKALLPADASPNRLQMGVFMLAALGFSRTMADFQQEMKA